jgi:tripartite-type tricarboxylate transporter receptor subunit TctC
MTEVLLAVRLRRAALIITLSVLLAAPAWRDAIAEEYPSRIVSLVIAFPAGGGVDTIGRAIAQKLTDALGQQVIVVNRPGAGSVIGTRDVAKARPDGYTLLLLVTGAPFRPIRATTWKRTSRRLV